MKHTFDWRPDGRTLELMRETEARVAERFAREYEAFCQQLISNGHTPGEIEVRTSVTGKSYGYECPRCKAGAIYAVNFNVTHMRFEFDGGGSAIVYSCEDIRQGNI